jgi:cytochrome c peroxidase
MRAPMFAAGLVVAAVIAAGCEKKDEGGNAPKSSAGSASGGPSAVVASPTKIDPVMLAVFQPLPKKLDDKANPTTPEKVALGRQLYFDERLSKNHDVSCNSCHDLAKYGVDGQPVSDGHRKQKGTRNAPTVYNAAVQLSQFWDGRAKNVDDQATGPILNPKEMAMPDEKSVVLVLTSMPEYVAAFEKAFPGEKQPVRLSNVGKAIGAFERTLLTPSRFDRYVGGDKTALTDAELAGLKLFLDTGCQSCHMGVGVGGTAHQKLGLAKPWPDEKDLGRYEVTKQEGDKMVFKVPILRNVGKTPPYFHDGSRETLDAAVKAMAEHQLGKTLTDEQAKSIVTFLQALTGELPTDVGSPQLPKSTAKTPAADPG